MEYNISITYLKKDLDKIVGDVIKYWMIVNVSSKNGNTVIISEDEYKDMLETINSSSQNGLVEKIKEGEKEDISKMSTYEPNEDW